MFGLSDEVEQQAEQHLQVERHHREQAPAIGERVVALHLAAHRGERRADGGDEGDPANPGMKQQDGRVHAETLTRGR